MLKNLIAKETSYAVTTASTHDIPRSQRYYMFVDNNGNRVTRGCKLHRQLTAIVAQIPSIDELHMLNRGKLTVVWKCGIPRSATLSIRSLCI